MAKTEKGHGNKAIVKADRLSRLRLS